MNILKLMVVVEPQNRDGVLSSLRFSIASFLSKNPSAHAGKLFSPGSDLWMAHENNTFTCEISTYYAEDWHTAFRRALSNLMIYESLPLIENDENTISEVLLLHFCLCNPYPIELCREIYASLFSHHCDVAEVNVESEYYSYFNETVSSFVSANKAQLDHYYFDVRDHEGYFADFLAISTAILSENMDEKVFFSRLLQLHDFLEIHYGLDPIESLYTINVLKLYFNGRVVDGNA